MRILVLSRGRSVFATNRLVEEGERAGHVVRVVDPAACSVAIGRSGGVRSASGRPLDGEVDCVLPRIGSGPLDEGIAVVAAFEARGVAVVNGSRAIATARDKLTCLQTLERAGVPVPRTVLVRQASQAERAVRDVGGPPVAVKLRLGSGGIGVVAAQSSATAVAVVQTVLATGQSVLVQEWVGDPSVGRDVRVLVVDGEPLAAMERTARSEEHRANVHRGGRVRPHRLDEPHARLAVLAARAVGLEVAGVDLVQPADGADPAVLEVNASPGLEGIERATGVNAARAVVRLAARCAGAGQRREVQP